MRNPQGIDTATAAAAPPVTVAGITFLGHPVADWVQVVAIVWLVLQIGWFIWSKIIREDKDK